MAELGDSLILLMALKEVETELAVLIHKAEFVARKLHEVVQWKEKEYNNAIEERR